MKSPLVSTLLMGVIALLATSAAAYYYPWPEASTTTGMLNEPLFDDYEYTSVRSMEIVRFNRDTNSLDKIVLRRKGEKWVIPGKGNFVATQSKAISSAVDSLKERVVHEIMSDQQQDHVEYGVVDPADYQSVTNLSGLGIRIKLSDRNDKEIASLIVGKDRKNDAQRARRFVRRPGQPQVYSIDYDINVLSTDFPIWVSANLMNIQTRENVIGERPVSIRIEDYRIDPTKMASAPKKQRYLVDIGLDPTFSIQDLLVADRADGQLVPSQVTEIQTREISQIGRFLGNILFTDVVKKKPELAKALRAGKKATTNKAFASLAEFGFRIVENDGPQLLFESARGAMNVKMANGVEIKLYVGKSTGNLNVYSKKPDNYMMMTAHVDEGFFALPEKPETDDPESTENKAYLKAVKARESKLKLAGDVAKALNRSYSNWFYIIDDTVADGLVPSITTMASPARTPATGQPKSSDAKKDDAKKDDAKKDDAKKDDAKKDDG